MNDKLKNFTDKIAIKFGNKKIVSIILILGISGMVLIGFSDSIFNNKSSPPEKENLTVEEYIQKLEKKTMNMLKAIDGAGRCKIMITAESSSEQSFATDDSVKQDNHLDGTENKNSVNIEKEIVMVEDSNGNKVALVKNVIEPKIRGILILAEGADNIETKEKITNAVKTLLGVTSNKISVIKMS